MAPSTAALVSPACQFHMSHNHVDHSLPPEAQLGELKISNNNNNDHAIEDSPSPKSLSRRSSSSARRTSFGSIEEDDSGVAQSFVDTKETDPPKEHSDSFNTALRLQQSGAQAPDFCCPCGAFLGWKQIRLSGRRQSRSYSDLRALGSPQSLGFAWESTQKSASAIKEEAPKKKKGASIEKLPVEILDQIISYLAIDIPPNGYTPRNIDLISCLLTSRTLHSATLGVLYRNITIPHSIIFSKALNHIRQYPSLGTIVRRLDFSHFTSVGLGRTQQMNVEIQNLTSKTLLQCLDLLPNLKELLLQEHVEDDVNGDVVRKIFVEKDSLRALDFCGSSSTTFSSGFVSAVMDGGIPDILPRLKRLSLHECTGLPDEAIRALLPRLVCLTHLDLAHTQITNDTLTCIPRSAHITHLNLSRCTKLTGSAVVDFLTTHPAVTKTLVYLNLMVDVSRHRLLEEEDVDRLLPHLTSTLHSLNLGGARITSAHMPCLLRLSKHVEELGLSSASLTVEDLNSFFAPEKPASDGEKKTKDGEAEDPQSEWQPPKIRYLDLNKNPYLTQAVLLNPRTCHLITQQSYPLLVIELSERIITPLRQRSANNRSGWVVRELGRRGWYVREPYSDVNNQSMVPDNGLRSWKMGAHWWGMRKIPVSVGEVGGIYGHYMFKK